MDESIVDLWQPGHKTQGARSKLGMRKLSKDDYLNLKKKENNN